MMPRRDITVYQPISANLCKRAHTGHPFFFSQFVAIRLEKNVVELLKNFLFNVYGRFMPMGSSIKDVESFWPFLMPPTCRNFDPDLPNLYLLISCNIGILDPLLFLKYFDVFYR